MKKVMYICDAPECNQEALNSLLGQDWCDTHYEQLLKEIEANS